jgi:hypothetical protein
LVQSTKAATLICLVLATGLGTWYLRVRVPDNDWHRADLAGQRSLIEARFGEAERHFTLAVHTARGFGELDSRLGLSLFHLAQALVGQSNHAAALPLLEQAVVIQSKALGRDHPAVLRTRLYQDAVLRKLAQLADSNQAQGGLEAIDEELKPSGQEPR